MAFGMEFPHYFDACARLEQRATGTPEQGSHEAAAFEMGMTVHDVVVASLEAGQRDGSIRADLGDLQVTSRVLWGFTHGLTQIAITKARPAGGGRHYGDAADSAGHRDDSLHVGRYVGRRWPINAGFYLSIF